MLGVSDLMGWIGLVAGGDVGKLGPLGAGAFLFLEVLEAVRDEAGAGRDQLADDHILLEAEERVRGGTDGRARQHLDGVLERGGGEERVGAEGGLGYAEENFAELSGLLAFREELLVDLAHL